MASFREASRAIAHHRKRKAFDPGGEKGKLHRALGIPEGQKIPHDRLMAAMHSKDREVRDMAIRANTMMHWHHK